MSPRKEEEIKKLIDHMQSGLVELFDQFRELRRLLDVPDSSESAPVEEAPVPTALFSGASDRRTSSSIGGFSSPTSTSDESDYATVESEAAPVSSTSSSELEWDVDFSSVVETVLDDFAGRVQAGEVIAKDLATYLESAKTQLITKEHPNDRVERDMNIVLQFLKKRGTKGIRPEERDNILKRIQRWKAHLTVGLTKTK